MKCTKRKQNILALWTYCFSSNKRESSFVQEFKKAEQQRKNKTWNHATIREFFEDLKKKMNFSDWTDFYKMTYADVIAHGGRSFMHKYKDGNTMAQVLSYVYPEHAWDESKFASAQKGKNWRVLQQRIQLNELMKKLELKSLDDWYTVEFAELQDEIWPILARTYGSYFIALATIYPEHNWKPWKFNQTHSKIWDNHENRFLFLEYLAEKLKISKLDDWYKLRKVDFTEHGGKTGSALINKFNGSVYAFLSTMMPQHKWNKEKFPDESSRFSISQSLLENDLQSQRNLMESMKSDLNIQSFDDWYKVTLEDLLDRGAKKLLNLNYESIYQLLCTVYPEYPWKVSNFDKLPSGYWEDLNNQRKFFDTLAEKMQITDQNGWYNLEKEDIIKNGGRGLMELYGNSVSKAITTVYSEYDWKYKNFNRKPRYFWREMQNQKDFLLSLGKKLGYTRMEDWYQITTDDFIKNGGAPLLSFYYGGSAVAGIFKIKYNSVMTILSEFDWDLYKFPLNKFANAKIIEVTSSKDYHKQFFEKLGKSLNIKELEDWYSVKKSDFFRSKEAILVMRHYKGSHIEALKSIYPDFPWKEYLFEKTPEKYWDDKKNIKSALEHAYQVLKLNSLKDWQFVTSTQIFSLGMNQLVAKYGGMINLLEDIYPEQEWEKFPPSMKAQPLLFKKIVEIFPTEQVHYNYLHPKLVFNDTGKSMQLDVFLPNLNLAFEYHGLQHYDTKQIISHPTLFDRDIAKKEACSKHGITLIEIPYWWDHTSSSLIATINKYRPELVEHIFKKEIHSTPIPEKVEIKLSKKKESLI